MSVPRWLKLLCPSLSDIVLRDNNFRNKLLILFHLFVGCIIPLRTIAIIPHAATRHTNIQEIRANEELSNFIFDKKIIKVLNSNDINTYGQLKRIEDLTSLKGVGAKTIEKINKYINK